MIHCSLVLSLRHSPIPLEEGSRFSSSLLQGRSPRLLEARLLLADGEEGIVPVGGSGIHPLQHPLVVGLHSQPESGPGFGVSQQDGEPGLSQPEHQAAEPFPLDLVVGQVVPDTLTQGCLQQRIET